MMDTKARVIKLMEAAGRPMTAGEILRDAVNLHVPGEPAASRILSSILGSDPRAERDGNRWILTGRRPDAEETLDLQAAFLHLQEASGIGGPYRMRGALFLPACDFATEFVLTGRTATCITGSLSLGRTMAAGKTLVLWHPKDMRLWNQVLESCSLEPWDGTTLCLSRMAHLVLRMPVSKLSLEELAMELALPAADPESPAGIARFFASVFKGMTILMPHETTASWHSLLHWMRDAAPKVDFSRFSFDRRFLKELPDGAGVYLMKNRAGQPIYVGKSRCLRRRVGSYFNPRASESPKVLRIQEALHSIEICETPNEVEALILEMRLIRNHRPAINLQTGIHKREGFAGGDTNLLLLVAGAHDRSVRIYFMKQGAFAGQISCRLGLSAPKRVLSRIRSVFFGPRRARVPRREPWEIVLVSRWLASSRRRLNYVNIDHAGSYEHAVRQLNAYLTDTDGLGRKVIYR